jgi:hypothetical protein
LITDVLMSHHVAMLVPIAIPSSTDFLDLEPTRDGLGYAARIARRRSDDSTSWIASPPRGEQHDAWTSVRMEASRVIACSWSGYEVELDLETGREFTRRFTK